MVLPSILTIIIVIAVFLLAATTIPRRNVIDGNTLTTIFLLGNKQYIDLTGAEFTDVPEDSRKHLIRTGGTSIGKINYGRFKNIKTGSKFFFLTTGRGERRCFVKDGVTYIIDIEQ